MFFFNLLVSVHYLFKYFGFNQINNLQGLQSTVFINYKHNVLTAA